MLLGKSGWPRPLPPTVVGSGMEHSHTVASPPLRTRTLLATTVGVEAKMQRNVFDLPPVRLDWLALLENIARR